MTRWLLLLALLAGFAAGPRVCLNPSATTTVTVTTTTSTSCVDRWHPETLEDCMRWPA